MTETKYSNEIKKKLLKLIKKGTDAKVVAIKGAWGSGKSTFYKDFIQDDKYNNAYVSLYGLKSIEDIENSILLKISEVAQIENFFSNKPIFEDLKICGLNAKAILSSLTPSTFKEIVICLDDFERLSNKITINELFGFISDLNENKKCKVVLILNEDKINEENREYFDIQKEKVIDFEILFNPDLDYVKKIIDPANEYEKILYDFIEKFEIKNIRTIKKIINTLDNFLLNKSLKDVDKTIQKVIFKKFIELSFVYYQFNFKDFNLYCKYQSEKISQPMTVHLKNKKRLKSDEETLNRVRLTDEFLDKNKYLEEYFIYLSDLYIGDLENVLVSFIINHELKEHKFDEYLEGEKYKLENSNLINEINKIINKYEYDFSYTLEEYDKELFDFLTKYQAKILKLKNLESIKQEIKNVKSISKNDYDLLLINMQNSFLDQYEYKDYERNIDRSSNYEDIMKENNPQVMTYLDNLLEYNKNPKSSDIIAIFERVINTQKVTKNSDKDTINKLSIKQIKEFLLTDKSFVEILTDDFDRHRYFQEFKNTLTLVFKELKEDSKYKIKIGNLEREIFS